MANEIIGERAAKYYHYYHGVGFDHLFDYLFRLNYISGVQPVYLFQVLKNNDQN